MFAALQVVEKVTLVNKMEQFDRFFEKGFRKRASLWMPISIPGGNMDWADLQNLHAGRTMSPDLLAYFILKQKGLSKDYRRQILLSTGSAYDLNSIERFKKHPRKGEKVFFPEYPRKGYDEMQEVLCQLG